MKKVPPMLEHVLKNSENTKLILLSAPLCLIMPE